MQQTSLPIGGTCLSCHEDISDMHPSFALACVDCHGGDDQVPELAENLKAKGEDVFDVDVRDQRYLRASHVLPRDPSLWWANGVDDNGDGRVDEAGEFFDADATDEGLAPRKQHDSELNSDINYLRFLNPGDLRVAAVSCGNRNRHSNGAMVCHADVVYDVRRSLMANNPAVPAGAHYGNAQRPRAADFGAGFAASAAGARFDARDPRIGRVGYAYDYDALDDAYDVDGNAWDEAGLFAAARDNADPGDDDRMAVAGALVDDGSDEFDPGVGQTRFGNALKFPDRAVEVLQPIPSRAERTWPPANSTLELRLQTLVGGDVKNGFNGEALTNPVDAALRHFRPYQTLNVTGTNDNFGAVDVSEGDVERGVELAHQNSPFGRGRPSGCTACHVPYRVDGKNEEPFDRTVADNGRQPSTDLPFGLRAERGERFYAQRHQIKRTVEMQTCGSCHGFVTRVDLAYSGATENEGDLTRLPEKIVTLSPVSVTTPRGSRVRIFDNLARFKDGAVVNDGEGVSEDDNGNGELDPGEDADGDGVLSLPDRDPRSASFDGRQPRVVYGGRNGTTRLADVHFQAGLQCVDCHSQQDVHGDGNIYTRNWDAIEIECDDCHGTPTTIATLTSSGPNGGTDLAKIATAFGEPWFTRDGDTVVQRSRTQRGLSWTVPQLKTDDDDEAAYAHRQPLEVGSSRVDLQACKLEYSIVSPK